MANEARRTTKVNAQQVKWSQRRSPKGRFTFDSKRLSIALDAQPRAMAGEGDAPGARPFEVDLFRLPGGGRAFPLHAHSAQWEYYIFLDGEGEMVQEDAPSIPVGPGDHVLQPPGWAHTIVNTGSKDLTYYVVASNPTSEVVHHLDSDKWLLLPERQILRPSGDDFYAGEE